jgi:predicted enzyme related to lactoylglutathione lyase
MGRRTSYSPGTFCWVDLATADADAAKSFYTRLFGWELEDTDAGDSAVYTICRLNGDAVCGLFDMSTDLPAAGVAPNWTSYVTVADVDAVAAGATRLGGDVINDVFDVLDVGRMAVLKDPQGAVVAAWQPGTRIGAERVNDVGCLCMNELVTTDIDAARSFYEALFGWTTEAWDTGPGGPPMALAKNGGTVNASFIGVQGDEPARWRPCFTVESTDTAVERVRELGGSVVAEPFELPDGSLAVVLDPEGVLFSIFAGDVDP